MKIYKFLIMCFILFTSKSFSSEIIILSAIKLKLFPAKSIFEKEKINKKEKTINL